LIFGQRVGLIGIDAIDQMMPGADQLIGCRFAGADVHAPIDLARIRRDDLAVEVFSELDRQRGLAYASRADQTDEQGSGSRIHVSSIAFSIRVQRFTSPSGPISMGFARRTPC